MKTPIEELYDLYIKQNGVITAGDFRCLLQEEKDIIIVAFETGKISPDKYSGEDYYNIIFNK
jgi:hypothetical protein